MDNQNQQSVSKIQSSEKKPWYKKWWVIALGLVVLYVIGSSGINDAKKKTNEAKVQQEKNVQVEEVGNSEPTEKAVSEPALIELSGTGQQASQKFNLESGLSIFRLSYCGAGHFSIRLLDENGEYIELLVNTTGKFNGSKAIGIEKRGEYVMDISADEKWTIKIEQPRTKIAQSEANTFTGVGQQVSPLIKIDKGLKTFKMKHSGTGHFSIVLLDKNGEYIELLVNTTGQFDGSKAVGISKSDLHLLDISADGEWSIIIE